MRRPCGLVVAGLVLASAVMPPAAEATAPGPPFSEAAWSAARWIVSRQTADGAFFLPAARADEVAEALATVLAGGVGGEPVARALGYLGTHGPEAAKQRAAYAGRLVMGLVAAGQNPRTFGGFDYVAQLESFYMPSGAYDLGLYSNGLAELGVLAAGEPLPEGAVRYLEANQCDSGGFGHTEGCLEGADLDTTALIMNVLVRAGRGRSDSVSMARLFLRAAQNDESGFGLDKAHPETNANSTGLALSALAALGEDPRSAPWARAGANPLDVLLSLQHASGAFKWRADTAASNPMNNYATVQAVPGAAGRAYPLRPPFQAPPQPTGNARALQARRAIRSRASSQPSAAPQAESSPAQRASASRAAIAIRFRDSHERRFCIDLPSETISGLDGLRRTGLRVETRGFGRLGAAVCMIDGFGNDLSDCPGAKGHWHYWHWDGSSWRESSLGASNYAVKDGAVEGWTWQAGGAATAPGTVDLERICSSTRRRVAPAGPPRREGVSIDALVFLSVLVALGALGFSASRRGGGAASE